MHRQDLGVEPVDVRRRAADVGVDVLVQLAAEPGEAPDDEAVRRERERRRDIGPRAPGKQRGDAGDAEKHRPPTASS